MNADTTIQIIISFLIMMNTAAKADGVVIHLGVDQFYGESKTREPELEKPLKHRNRDQLQQLYSYELIAKLKKHGAGQYPGGQPSS